MTKQKFTTPTIFVIFGATGDLSQQKLFPALFDLFEKGYLPEQFGIVGVAHSEETTDSLQEMVRGELCGVDHEHTQEMVDDFVSRLNYVRGSFDDAALYADLVTALKAHDDAIGQCTNKLFHLAVSPHFYPTIIAHLADTKLTEPCSPETGWTRVLLEKPLGETAEAAQHVDALLADHLQEEQVFRIDHYLGKETIQNILTFRFANVLFAPVWNKDYIARVDIRLHETADVDARGAFYDRVGAFMDVGQNHMLQMLSLVAMEHPETLDAQAVRAARAEVVKHVHVDEASVVRGQYNGYRDIVDVGPASEAETYFHMTMFIDTPAWEGVPFTLESGKALDRKCTEIVVTFKEAQPCLCPGVDPTEYANQITFVIQPEEQITVRFLAKKQSFANETQPQDLSFNYTQVSEYARIDAYEKILYDAIVGDQTLFRSAEEVAVAWTVVAPLLEKWQTFPLQSYEKGSAGPV